MFGNGHFYGCISLAQLVAEGISICGDKHGLRATHHRKRVKKLAKARAVPEKVIHAFKTPYVKDRVPTARGARILAAGSPFLDTKGAIAHLALTRAPLVLRWEKNRGNRDGSLV